MKRKNAKTIFFTAIDKALASLHAALEPAPRNDRERDGAIQRFEYTFELVWKLAKRVLETQGIDSSSPRSVIRDMAQQNWISEVELWMDFLDARNLTVHTYEQKTAEEVFKLVRRFYPECASLVAKLKAVKKT